MVIHKLRFRWRGEKRDEQREESVAGRHWLRQSVWMSQEESVCEQQTWEVHQRGGIHPPVHLSHDSWWCASGSEHLWLVARGCGQPHGRRSSWNFHHQDQWCDHHAWWSSEGLETRLIADPLPRRSSLCDCHSSHSFRQSAGSWWLTLICLSFRGSRSKMLFD